MNEPHPHGGRSFPAIRPRRLRYNPLVRDLVRETDLSAGDLILPLFVRPGQGVWNEIASMPGNYQLSVDTLVEEIGACRALGFGRSSSSASPLQGRHGRGGAGRRRHRPTGAAGRPQGPRPGRAARHRRVLLRVHRPRPLRRRCRERTGRLDVDNDATLPLLAEQCVSHARAGADLVAPSGMMDGMVGAIRAGLDAAGFSHVPIMSYAAKYASGFYGPFRDAAESPPRSATAAATRWTPPTATRR